MELNWSLFNLSKMSGNSTRLSFQLTLVFHRRSIEGYFHFSIKSCLIPRLSSLMLDQGLKKCSIKLIFSPIRCMTLRKSVSHLHGFIPQQKFKWWFGGSSPQPTLFKWSVLPTDHRACHVTLRMRLWFLMWYSWVPLGIYGSHRVFTVKSFSFSRWS